MRLLIRLTALALLATVLALAPPTLAQAGGPSCDKTWVGGSDSWSRDDLPPNGQAQWSGGTLPNGSQSICFPAGSYTVAVNVGADAVGLTIGDNTAGPQPTLALVGSSASFGGGIRVFDVDSVNYGTISLGSTAFANDASFQQEDGTTITNHGTVNLIQGAGGQRVIARGTWVNQGTIRSSSSAGLWGCMTLDTTGTVDVDPGATLTWANCGQTRLNVNAGSVINDGKLEANTGLHLGSTSAITGANPVGVTGGAAVTFGGTPTGKIQLLAGSSVAGTIPAGVEILVDNPADGFGSTLAANGNVINNGKVVLTSIGNAGQSDITLDGAETFTNNGEIEMLAGGGGNRILHGGTYLNHGTIDITSPDGLYGCTSLTSDDTITLDDDATLTWANCGQTNLTLNGGTVTNEGQIDVNTALHIGGTTTVTGNPIEAVGGANLTFAGTPTAGVQTIGSVGVTGTIPAGISLFVDNPADSFGSNLAINSNATNHGRIVLTSEGNAGTSSVNVSGTFVLTNNGTIDALVGGGGARAIAGGSYVNNGDINIASPDTTSGCTTITNTATGEIDVETGAAVVSNCAGLRLELDGGTVTNDGRLFPSHLTLGDVDLDGAVPIEMQSGTLVYEGDVSGAVQVPRGGISVDGTIPADATLLLKVTPQYPGDTASAHFEDNTTNNGTITLDSEVNGGARISQDDPDTFTNNGKIEMLDTSTGGRFLDRGVWINDGELVMSSAQSFGGCMTLRNRDDLTIDAGATYSTSCGGIHVVLEAGLAVVDGELEASTVTIDGGTLRGTGTVDADVTNDGGVVQPGNSTGILIIDGNYTQSDDGVLDIEIDGTATPGTQFDRLAINGNASLGGAIDVDANVIPSPAVAVLSAATVTGTFDEVRNIPTTWVNESAVAVTIQATPTFSDVSFANPFFLDIEWMAANGITTGFPNGTFQPSANLSREAMAAFLYRFAGSPVYTPPTTPSFSDVPKTATFYKQIEWMKAEGITTGFPNGTFQPSASLSREAMSAFMYRFAGSPVYTPPTTPTFSDVPTTATFYKQIEWMNAEGITTGFPNGTFRPTVALSRQAMSAFLHRLDAVLVDS